MQPLIKVPATSQGAQAIEELIFVGIPVNATLIFDAAQHRSVHASYIRGVERRRAQRLPLRVASVSSVFVSRWDQAANPFLPSEWRNRTGLGMAYEIQDDHLHTLAMSGCSPFSEVAGHRRARPSARGGSTGAQGARLWEDAPQLFSASHVRNVTGPSGRENANGHLGWPTGAFRPAYVQRRARTAVSAQAVIATLRPVLVMVSCSRGSVEGVR